MFTSNHFIWLAISVLLIVGLLILQKIKKYDFNQVITFMTIICLVSELVKIFSNIIVTTEGGYVLDPADLPFHLCSIQIFFIFALKWLIKKEETKEKLLCFMVPTMIIGGILALFIPTVGVKFARPQVYQFFIFHASIIAFSIYVLQERFIKHTWKSYFRNLGYLGFLALVATWINSILSVTNPKVNFFYLCRPPMEDLPLLNLDNGWGGYIVTLGILGILLVSIYQVIVMSIYKKSDKK